MMYTVTATNDSVRLSMPNAKFIDGLTQSPLLVLAMLLLTEPEGHDVQIVEPIVST